MTDMDAFFAMGGYGLYVWGSYGAAAIIVGYFALASWRRLRRAQRAQDGLEPRGPA